MVPSTSSSYSSQPKILIISDSNQLTDDLVKTLEENNCAVEVLERKIKHSEISNIFFDYVIYLKLSDLMKKTSILRVDNTEKELNFVRKISVEKNTKVLLVFPYSKVTLPHDNSSLIVRNFINDKKLISGAVYLGDLVFDNVKKHEYGLFYIVLESLASKKIEVYNSQTDRDYFPLSSQVAINSLIRTLFSLKVYGRKIGLLGKPMPFSELLKYIQFTEYVPTKNTSQEKRVLMQEKVDEVSYTNESKRTLTLKAYKNVTDNIENSLISKLYKKFYSESFLKKLNYASALIANHFPVGGVKKIKQGELNRRRRMVFRWRTLVLLILVTFVISPFLLVLCSVILLRASNIFFKYGNVDWTSDAINSSIRLSTLTEKYSLIFDDINYLKNIYIPLGSASKMLTKEAEAGKRFIILADKLILLTDRLTSDEDYDISDESKDIVLELDTLYKELAFLEGEIKSSDKLTRKIASLVMEHDDLKKIREKILYASRIAQDMPIILGSDKPSRYLILVQNNNILRATGGRIETLIFVTFNDGKLTDSNIVSVSFADKKLVGIADPPVPLQKYFDTPSWFLRDSNWDPDFLISAAQAEWFVDKELNEKVDGVVMIDTNFLSQVMSLTENVKVEGLDKKISSENFYEIVSDADTENSYPDLIEDNIHTRILRGLFENAEVITTKKKLKLVRLLLMALDEKKIQLSIKSRNAKQALTDLDWDGSISQSTCGDNCYSDLVAVVEVSKNDNSREITRESRLKVSIEEGLIKRKLYLYLENKSSESYPTYIRVFTKSDSGFSPIEVITSNLQNSVQPETRGVRGFKEVGTYIDIPAKSGAALLFSWESGFIYDYKINGEYKLMWNKQAGTAEYPLEITIEYPSKVSAIASEAFTLTKQGMLVYNTIVSRDIISRIFFQSNE